MIEYIYDIIRWQKARFFKLLFCRQNPKIGILSVLLRVELRD
jgi:hypothetical protein